VPHNFGNALARRWAPALPRPLCGGFLTLLYALRTMASADGRLRYERDGQAITISQIAKACRSDQKDVRTYLKAAIAAGVVGVVGDGKGRGRTRGRATMYALLLDPSPNWEAAAGVVWFAQQVKAEKRAERAERRAVTEPEIQHSRAADPAGSSGDSAPNPHAAQGSGDSPPNLAERSSGDSAPPKFGGQCPSEFGGQCPDHPGSTHELPHEMADVGPQAEVAREHWEGGSPPGGLDSPDPPTLCPVPAPRGGRTAARPAATSGSSGGQMPLLLSVPCGPVPDRADLTREQRDELRAAATPEAVRRAIEERGMADAARLYGWQLVQPHIPATAN
jgi:hypothetical protein